MTPRTPPKPADAPVPDEALADLDDEAQVELIESTDNAADPELAQPPADYVPPPESAHLDAGAAT